MLDTNISNFIEQQFPQYYREEGPLLVEFMKQYYVWLETDPTSPIYQARAYLDNHDIDSTVDQFVVNFKEKYLKNIQLNTATNTNQLIKNSVSLYRSKGTENAFKLFFDLIFSSPSEIYYPGNDIFKLSDAEWVIPQYIEVQSRPVNRMLVGRQIKGVYSGATAFVEKLVRRKVKNTFIEVFYVSALNGKFKTGEIITLSGSNEYDLADFPKMTGSLNTLDVVDGGDGFKVGDVVSLESRTGDLGKAIVQDLETITGIVDFDLLDGGWGYTSNSVIYVSNNVLQLQNVKLQTTANTTLYNKIKTVYQPTANVQWYANTKSFAVGETIYNYEANGAVRGVSRILDAEYGNSNTTNYYRISSISGNSAPYAQMPYTYYSAGNTNSFMIYNAGWTDTTATGTLNGMSSNVSIITLARANTFSQGEHVYQLSSNNQVTARARVIDSSSNNTGGNLNTIVVDSLEGLFLTNFPLIGDASGANISIDSCSYDIGVINTTGKFIAVPGNVLRERSSNSLFSATIVQIPFGSGASLGFDTDLINPEVVMINPNYLRDHLDETDQRNWINSASYGASLNNANLYNPILGEALRFEPKTIGTIARLKNENPGKDYSYAPFVVAYDPLIAPLAKSDFLIRLTGATGVFRVGELVTQAARGGKGLVKSANTTEVHIRRLTYEDRWSIGSGTQYLIKGETSGFQANIKEITYDTDGVAGQNAKFSANVTSSSSAALSLKVSDSGFNYRNGESVRFTSSDELRAGNAITYVTSHGSASGFHKTSSSFLSSDKKLYDGEYYQDFSYEIRSPITVERYSDMLKNILHVSGTRAFSSILKSTSVDSSLSSSQTSVSFS